MSRTEAGIVLMYHRVGPSPDPSGLTIEAGDFSEQMEHLRMRWCPVSLQALAAAGAQRAIPERAVAVTFDDGYAETARTVAPILEALDVPATFFVATEHLDTGGEFWWDELDGLPAGAHAALRGRLVEATFDERERLLESAREESRARPARPDRRALCREEVRDLARRFDVGAHTVHHLCLPTQSDDVVRRELADNRTALESLCGHAVTGLAYPYGRADARVAALVREGGFAFAVTCTEGAVLAGGDPLLLPRIEVPRGGLAHFAAHVEDMLEAAARATA